MLILTLVVIGSFLLLEITQRTTPYDYRPDAKVRPIRKRVPKRPKGSY